MRDFAIDGEERVINAGRSIHALHLHSFDVGFPFIISPVYTIQRRLCTLLTVMQCEEHATIRKRRAIKRQLSEAVDDGSWKHASIGAYT